MVELERAAAEARVDVETISRGVRYLSDLVEAKARLSVSGTLSPAGCFLFWPPELEFSLLEPEERTASFEALAGRAYSVLLVEVEEARLG